jgi:hypothetical protein
MNKRWTSAFLPTVALLVAGCSYDFNRYDPAAAGVDGGALPDVGRPEPNGADAEGELDSGAGDTSASGKGGDASVVDTGPSNESGAPGDGGSEASGTTYTIGGMLQGMKQGRSVTLQDNGGDDLVVPMNGAFAFARGLGSGASYDVSVSAQPPGQTCAVTAGSGVVAASNVTSVVVTCR